MPFTVLYLLNTGLLRRNTGLLAIELLKLRMSLWKCEHFVIIGEINKVGSVLECLLILGCLLNHLGK